MAYAKVETIRCMQCNVTKNASENFTVLAVTFHETPICHACKSKVSSTTKRKCLKCDEPFDSFNNNRICTPCKSGVDFMID